MHGVTNSGIDENDIWSFVFVFIKSLDTDVYIDNN